MNHEILKTSEIRFLLGEQEVNIDFSVSNYKPTTTLLQYLRSLPDRKSVKEGCAEGDCGACTVVFAEIKGNALKYKAVNSCIVFLASVHGKQILTVEDLGKGKHLHPIQEAMVEEDAGQCGFCTPGFTMSIFGLYKNNNEPEKSDIETALSGNLCRCTGYRPILDAAERACIYKGMDKFTGKEHQIFQQLTEIKSNKEILFLKTEQNQYYLPFSLSDLLHLKKENPDALLAGGTSDIALRVTKKKENLPLIIDISQLDELKTISKNDNIMFFGAGCSLEDVRIACEKEFPSLFSILSVFGSLPVRNNATISGNIGSASPISDTLPVLMALDASLEIQNIHGKREQKIEDFIVGYRKTTLSSDEIITRIKIPFQDKNNILKSYKVSKRRDLDISTVNAGFMLNINNRGLVESIKLVYGGMAAFTKRATQTEKSLLNKEWCRENVENALKNIQNDFSPISDARAGAEARQLLAENLLLKFWNETRI